MAINRIFKRNAERQVKLGIKLKAHGVKNLVLPFIIKPDPSKHVHPRRDR